MKVDQELTLQALGELYLRNWMLQKQQAELVTALRRMEARVSGNEVPATTEEPAE